MQRPSSAGAMQSGFYVYAELEKGEGSERPQATVAEIIGELPATVRQG